MISHDRIIYTLLIPQPV